MWKERETVLLVRVLVWLWQSTTDMAWPIVATGSSVTKTASGGEEIVVQGDNSDDIFDWVVDVGKVPEDNVECIEDKKKKSAG